MSGEPPRKIIHVDMDAFYASVEQRDRPDLSGRPLAVGGSPAGRGVVAAASYEARAFGVRSAMPAARALRLCPDITFVRPRFDVYRAVSHQVRAILADYSNRIEPLALDEAYLDVTGSDRLGGSATRIAAEIRRRIRDELGLTASAGVSCNKLLAKLASDQDKPDGLYVIPPHEGPGFLAPLPLERIPGIGPATAAHMRRLGLETIGDLRRWRQEALVAEFGRVGARYYWLARAVDDREVVTRRVRKSVGQEHTYAEDLTDPAVMAAELERLAGQVAQRLAAIERAGRTLTVKVRFADFSLVTRSRTLPVAMADVDDMRPLLAPLLTRALPAGACVRLLGVTVSNLQSAHERQQPLWEEG